MTELGKYSKGFITDVPANLNSDRAKKYKDLIFKYPMEGVYVYCFAEGRMVYADGWNDVAGIADDEINMLGIVNMSSPKFTSFVHEFNDKALKFIHSRKKNLLDYSFTIELKIINNEGMEIPVRAKVMVHEVNKDGSLKCIMGRFQVDYGLRFGDIMRYATYGEDKEQFERELSEHLFYKYHISEKELEVLRLISRGISMKEISDYLHISKSAAEKRLASMYKRFNVKTQAQLVSFAYENNLLP